VPVRCWRRRDGGTALPAPLLDAVIVAATAVAARHPVPGFTVLDAGCGEGFYLSRLQTALAQEDGCFLGLDLSKTAARMAAAANKSALFFVGDLRERITCADHTVHLLLNIFAPRNPAEFARVMASHGRLLTLIPTPRHLQGLLGAEDVIGMETAKEEKVEAAMAPYFDLLVVEEITFPLTVQGEQLVDLVQMTPRARHLPPEKYTQMRRWSAVDTTVSVQMLLFAPKPDGLLPTG